MEFLDVIFGAGFAERLAGGDEFTLGLTATAILIVLVLLGVRVVYATAIVGLFGLTLMLGWFGGATNAGMIPYAKASIYSLSVLPMFILIGYLAYHAGMTEALFDAAKKWIGWVPGGLAVATVFATAGFAAVSGGKHCDGRSLRTRCYPGDARSRLQ